jgi:16S rRNA (cytosine1402-N4)-methyltransferase
MASDVNPPSTPTHGHVPVLLDACVEHLAPAPHDVVVDLTVGRGGHAAALGRHLSSDGTLVLCDLDRANLTYATDRVKAETAARVLPFHCSFARIPRELLDLNLHATCVLGDLGFASNQMDAAERGFSIMRDGPLDMRLDASSGRTVAAFLASVSEDDLAFIIRQYGEDPLARAIARFLVRRRDETPIETTADLARCVHKAYGHRAHSSRLHPATRTFQALRIAVNDELGALEGLLRQVDTGARAACKSRSSWLGAKAKVALITFHSLEDRLVKQAFTRLERQGFGTRSVRKPIVASESEVASNSRARSAKLRVATVGVPSD